MESLLQFWAKRAALVCALALLLLGVSGCAGVGVVPVDRRILFDSMDSSTGSFRQGGLTVDYSYRLAAGKITVAGQFDYPRGFDSLTLRLLFLDAGGTVLQQKAVYFSGYRLHRSWLPEARNFQETLQVPPGAEGISFSYSLQQRRNYK